MFFSPAAVSCFLQAHKLGLDMSLQDLTNVFDAADIDHSTKIGAWQHQRSKHQQRSGSLADVEKPQHACMRCLQDTAGVNTAVWVIAAAGAW